MCNIEAIIIIVDRGKADKIVKIAKKHGANGATIFYGRGTGGTEAKHFFNIEVDDCKEIIIILSEKNKVNPIMDAISKEKNLDKPGKGIIFSFPISRLIGLNNINI
ncbi:P-II family nitrogen regulator [Hathewaya histolytica]|uniref:Nitrogen regulatory protein P-II n=1 Tax=Hathewaya histolytica TaxID=1498 RepID=A0A4U9QSY9_HATHI|nr:P-II family nitrogen regulator [Hathewaya histolytica]VTQ81686.1 nitrogen regulatory protein P-II [Hathewaya histolytica]